MTCKNHSQVYGIDDMLWPNNNYFMSLQTPMTTDNTMVTTDRDTPARYFTDSNFCASIWVLIWAAYKIESSVRQCRLAAILLPTSLSILLLVLLICWSNPVAYKSKAEFSCIPCICLHPSTHLLFNATFFKVQVQLQIRLDFANFILHSNIHCYTHHRPIVWCIPWTHL